MSIQLNNFLNNYITDDVGIATHCTSVDKDPKKQIHYSIPEDKTMEFYDIYSNAYTQNPDLYMGEIQKDYGPIIIDIDLKYKPEENQMLSDVSLPKTRKYDTILEKIIKIYIKIISKYLYLKIDNIKCFVLEKKEPFWYEERNMFSDGLHMVFPYICIPAYFQKFIRIEFIKIAKEIELFNNLNLLNNLYGIVDYHIISDISWRMYGSKKYGTNYPYLLTKIYNNNLDLLDITKYKFSVLVHLLSIRKFSKNNITGLNAEFIEKFSNINTNTNMNTNIIILCIILIIFYIYYSRFT